MVQAEIIASLERTTAHLSHILEDWSRDCENQNLASMCAHFDEPNRRLPVPPIDIIYMAVQCLARLTAIDKTITQLKNPGNANLLIGDSVSGPALSSSKCLPSPAPTSSTQSTSSTPSTRSIPSTSSTSASTLANSQTPAVPHVPSVPASPSVPSMPSVSCISPVHGVLSASQILAIVSSTNTLYAETAAVAAAEGIDMPAPAEFDLLPPPKPLHLNPNTGKPSMWGISESTKELRATLKSLSP